MQNIISSPIFIAFFLFFSLETFFFYPKTIYLFLALINLLFFFTLNKILKNSEEKTANYFILPAFFSAGLIFYSILLENKLAIQFLFILNIGFIYIYFKAILLWRKNFFKDLKEALSEDNEQKKEEIRTFWDLENIFSYGNFLAFFFCLSFLYGAHSYLSLRTLEIIFIASLIIFILLYNIIFSILKFSILGTTTIKDFISWKKTYLAIYTLLFAELVLAGSFLPFSYNIIGLILAIFYYILIGLIKHYLKEDLEKRRVKLYLWFGFSVIILLIITARWL